MASGDTLLVFTPLHNEPPASAYATLDLRNAHPLLDFDGSADEEAVFTALLPRHYAGGGLTAILHVAFSSATSGTSRWQAAIERIDASGLDIDADSFAAFQSAGASVPGMSGHGSDLLDRLHGRRPDGQPQRRRSLSPEAATRRGRDERHGRRHDRRRAAAG